MKKYLLIIMLLFFVYGRSQNIRKTTKQLFKEFDSNMIRAKAKYKGKMLFVRGYICDITYMSGLYVVILESKNDLGYKWVYAVTSKQQILKVSKGQQVWFQGVFWYYDSVFNAHYLYFRHCVFYKYKNNKINKV